jgi:hypothetical protein
MNRDNRIHLIIMCVVIASGTIVSTTEARDVSITAHVDRNRVAMFERITYTIKVESDSRRIPDPIPPEFTGFRQIGSPGTSSQFSWVNGQVSNVRTFTYTLEAREPGDYTIDPARVETSDRTLRSASVSVTVVRPGDPGARDQTPGTRSGRPGARERENLFLETVADKQNPYVGEPVRISYYVYTRVNIRDYGIQEEPEYHGFWVEQPERPQQIQLRQRYIDGMEYGEAKIHDIILYPTVTGELIIPPMIMAFQIQERRRDPFDEFFSSPFQSGIFGTRQVSKSTQPVVLNVRPLPETGRPVDFGGGVGEFQLQASINTNRVSVGEAIIVSAVLSGDHGLKTISPPRAPHLENFKSFDPKPGDITYSSEIAGWRTRTFDYVFVPLADGEFLIPGITFSYFDTKTDTYQTLTTESFTVVVDATGGDTITFTSRHDGRELRLMNVDIRYIKTDSGIESYTPAYKTLWFAAFLISPILAVPVILFLDVRKKRLQDDILMLREIKAKSVAAKRFVLAGKACRNQDADCAIDTIAQAFASYLADRLGLPFGGITLRRIEQEMTDRGVEEKVINQVISYWEHVESARYSPVKPSLETIETLTATAQNLVNSLEKVKFKKSRNNSTGDRRCK